jgi:hypothetical protein
LIFFDLKKKRISFISFSNLWNVWTLLW